MTKIQAKNNTNKIKTFFKKKTNIIISICLAVVLLVGTTLAVVLPIVLKKPQTDLAFKIPALNLPIEERYALTKYNYDSLGETVKTLREDTMVVTKRNLKRATTTLLDDNYTISNNDGTLSYFYGLENADGNLYDFGYKYNTIDFDNFYLYPSDGIADGIGGARQIGAHFADEARAMFAGESDDIAFKKYGLYYKFMLLSQGYNITKQSQNLAVGTRNNPQKQAEFKAWLKKHPAADLQYGEVVGSQNAVEKEITLDPIYRAYHATGLYLPAGEGVDLKIENLQPGESISIVIALQNSIAYAATGFSEATGYRNAETALTNGQFSSYFAYTTNEETNVTTLSGHSFLQGQQLRQNKRMPWIHATFTFTENGTYSLGTPFGGIMHIAMNNCYSQVKTTFTGAVETPHYILGVTTPEYFDKYLRNAPGVVGALDTENGQLVGPVFPVDGFPSSSVTNHSLRTAKTDEIEKLALLWHSFFAVNESFTGGTYNRGNIVKFDQHVPAGAAVALGGYNYACPTGWYYSCMSYSNMTTSGNWGTLHEIGHNHASSYGVFWGFGDGKEGEVHNNALNVLCYIMFTDIPTSVGNAIVGVEHGEGANPYTSFTRAMLVKNMNVNDYSELGYFDMLNMYTNIMHSFSAEKFYELLYTYKDNGDMAYRETATSNRRSGFAYRCALVYGMNFTNYFNDIYKANITEDMYTAEQLKYLKKLPNYELIACKYAGGIDGTKTGGDYIVSFGSDIIFDLLENTKCSLDTEYKKGFSIISVSNPEHGSITSLGDGRYKYSFNRSYAGSSDKFSFRVKLSDGVIHEFTVYLRIKYNSGSLTTYQGLSTGTDIFETVESQVADMKPTSVTNISLAGTGDYTTARNTWELKIVDFYWKAPKSGKVTFTLLYDDAIKFYFGNNFNEMELLYTDTKDTKTWKEVNDKNIIVQEGKYYALRLYNVNTGGGGKAYAGCYFEGDANRQIQVDAIYHPYMHLGANPTEYKFEPVYLVSKKDGITMDVNGSAKGDWKVIEAPNDIQGGKYYFTSLTDPDTNEVISTVKSSKWNYLIDGQTNTQFHTTWSRTGKITKYPDGTPISDDDLFNKLNGNPKTITAENPHVFVIDTNKQQAFNYFTIYTRNTSNAVIQELELWISSDNSNYKLVCNLQEVAYSKGIANLTFDQVTGRYLKLVVKKTAGGNFTIINELDAGIKSNTQRLLPSTSSLLFTTKNWTNSANITGVKHGYMVSDRKNEKMVIRFKGTILSLYGAVGKNYGSADIKLDGKLVSTIDFSSSTNEPRKLLYLLEDLEDTTHTVEIITKSDRRVMINMLGVDYLSTLINAPNIYKERALTITVIVFVVLFAALLTLVLCLLFIPKFRNFMGGNKCILWMDKSIKNGRENRKAKRAEKKAQKAEQKRIAEIANGSVSVNAKPRQKAAENKPTSKPKTDNKENAISKSSATAAKQSTSKPAATKQAPASKPKTNDTKNLKSTNK